MLLTVLTLLAAPELPQRPNTPLIVVVSSDHLQERRGSDVYVRDQRMVQEISHSLIEELGGRSLDITVIDFTDFENSKLAGFFYYVQVDDIGRQLTPIGSETCPTMTVMTRARISEDTQPDYWGSRLGNADFGEPLARILNNYPCDASVIADGIAGQIAMWQIGDWPQE